MSESGRRIAFLTDPNEVEYYFRLARPVILEHNESHWNNVLVSGPQNPQIPVKAQQKSVVRLSPDGNRLAIFDYGRVTVFHIPAGEDPEASLTNIGDSLACTSLPSFSYNGDRVFCLNRGEKSGIHVVTIYDWAEDNKIWLTTSRRIIWDGKPCRPLIERSSPKYGCSSMGWNDHSIGLVSYNGKRFAVLYWGNCVSATCTRRKWHASQRQLYCTPDAGVR